MQPLQPSQRLGDFQIVRLLGKGGMGQVYEAMQRNPKRPVALKVLAPWLAEDEESLERFWREASVPAQLDHPAIVRIIATGKTEDGLAYYVMHLVRGISLADLIQHGRDMRTEFEGMKTTPAGESAPVRVRALPIPSAEVPSAALAAYRNNRFRFAAGFGAIAARALAHAHEKGFLHRDIKPSNLMIDHHDQLYLVDFGLTRALDPGASRTRPGTVHGTPWYMSPEQARGEVLDERSGIYSLGVTLYELITQGEGPFTANRENSAAVMAQVRAGQCLPLRVLAPNVPRRLEQIIQRAMQFRPPKRYQTAAELAADLEEIATTSTAPLTPSGSRRRRTGLQRFTRRTWAGAAVALLLVLCVLAYLLRTPPGPAQGGGSGSTPDLGGEETSPPPKPLPPGGLKAFFHRDRPPGTLTNLLRADHQPVHHRVLLGKGNYTPAPTGGLLIQSPMDNVPTLFGLDYLDDTPSEFSVDMRWVKGLLRSQNELGVFFGWRDRTADPLALVRFFTVQLDKWRDDKDEGGRVTVGTGQWTPRQGTRGGVGDLLAPLPEGQGRFSLKPTRDDWHTLRVRVEDEKITITVDDGAKQKFDLDWLLKTDKRLKDVSLGPQGALGVWVRNGMGHFRNATIKALAAGK